MMGQSLLQDRGVGRQCWIDINAEGWRRGLLWEGHEVVHEADGISFNLQYDMTHPTSANQQQPSCCSCGEGVAEGGSGSAVEGIAGVDVHAGVCLCHLFQEEVGYMGAWKVEAA